MGRCKIHVNYFSLAACIALCLLLYVKPHDHLLRARTVSQPILPRVPAQCDQVASDGDFRNGLAGKYRHLGLSAQAPWSVRRTSTHNRDEWVVSAHSDKLAVWRKRRMPDGSPASMSNDPLSSRTARPTYTQTSNVLTQIQCRVSITLNNASCPPTARYLTHQYTAEVHYRASH